MSYEGRVTVVPHAEAVLYTRGSWVPRRNLPWRRIGRRIRHGIEHQREVLVDGLGRASDASGQSR